VRGTHELSSTERETRQDSKIKPASEGHSPSVKRIGKYSEESQRARGTHQLSRTEERANQDSERNLVGEGHSPSVGRREDLVRSMKEAPRQRGHSRPDEHKRKHKSGQRKKASKRGALTSCGAHREGQMRTANGSR
jgi:hypothetical protein